MDLDNVFVKSNLDENKKKAKMIFGKLLINLRKSNHIKLYSMLESVVDANIEDNVIKLLFSDKSSFDMLNNTNDLGVLKENINAIQNGLGLSINCDAKEEFDTYKFETFLKQEFGKLLTIKKD
ncbi:MAG: hypothetical protein ACI4PF_00835 [Christensenellales bacterium]